MKDRQKRRHGSRDERRLQQHHDSHEKIVGIGQPIGRQAKP
jgi:hypothetical protein